MSGGGFIKIRRPPTLSKGVTYRLFSTSLVYAMDNRDKSLLASTKDSGHGDRTKFWRQVNSSKLDENNPFFLANRFLKNNPNYNLAVSSLTCSIINSILSGQFKGFELSSSDFDLLRKIEPIRLELPVDANSLAKVVGKYVRDGSIGKAGVYKFTNKLDGFCYIGSSISLANRLATGYLGPKLGGRVIDLAIKDTGLNMFNLELYIIPEEIVERINRDFPDVKNGKTQLKNITLALEQIFLLTVNPEYNVLKVAGSPAGLKRTPESMLPSFIKNTKATYFYDTQNKELIFISKSRGELAGLTPVGYNISGYIQGNNRLYLNRFFISDHPLSEDTYTTNLLSRDDLPTYIKKLAVDWRKAQMGKNVDSTRKETYSKQARPMELTNIKTGEVMIFASGSETAKYIQSLDPDYKASPGTISDAAKVGRVYKNLFKVKFSS